MDDGVERLMRIKKEDGRGFIRYSLRGLESFMVAAGMKSGEKYLLIFNKIEGKLSIY